MNTHPGNLETDPVTTLALADGRRLSYLQVGADDGPVVFHFHGHGSSRLEALMLAEQAASLGLRVIALDRPGIGWSDPKLGDRLLDWPDDVAQAADLLGIEKFAVQGMSAGGPYALACAWKLPHRLTGCSLISAVPPPNIARRTGPRLRRLVWWMAWLFPRLLRSRLRRMRPDDIPMQEHLEQRMQRTMQWLGGGDATLAQIPAMRDVLIATMMETARQGGSANRNEIERLVRPWGFDVRRLTIENMFLWHGDEDRIMPVGPAHSLARALPHCRARFYSDEGHFSVLVNRAGDLLAALRPA